MPYERYLIFAAHQYYPSGGMRDLVDEAETEEKAFELARKHGKTYDQVQVLDLVQRDTIWEQS